MKKILIGGSPCTHWSIAKTKNRETKPEGVGWELFLNYMIALEKYKPDYFLYENNKSMAVAIREEITRRFDFEPVPINSALVSAQSRQRLYWVGKRNPDGTYRRVEVEQPEDRGILLRDILESGACWREKPYTLDANYYKTAGTFNPKKQHSYSRLMVAEPVEMDAGDVVDIEKNKTVSRAIEEIVEKKGYIPEMFNPYNRAEITEKSPTLSTGSMVTSSCATLVFQAADGKQYPIYEVRDGKITIKDKQYPIKLADGFYIIRKLTVLECMRLQTVPEDYIFPVSDSQAYKMLGNGWTVDVIAHIMSHFDGISSEPVEVLSMYDGMSCGHIALDKLGASITGYYATEIDKYAIKTTQTNYPDTVQLGDAFQVREIGWSLP